MSASVATVTEDTPAREVANLMYTKNIKRVPVVRDGKLVGILARSDLIRGLAQKLEETSAVETIAHGTLNEALRLRRRESGG